MANPYGLLYLRTVQPTRVGQALVVVDHTISLHPVTITIITVVVAAATTGGTPIRRLHFMKMVGAVGRTLLILAQPKSQPMA